MANYVILANFTDQGIRNYSDTTKRAKAFEEMVDQMGGEVENMVWTMGIYDVVALIDLPDDETATAAALKLASMGNVRTTTLRGFNKEEIEAVIAKIG